MGIQYRIVAANPAVASENRIHADEVARRYGFQGGLVPGVTVYGYACHALVQALGTGWVDHGSARVRFLAPCYEGEELVVEVTPAPLAFEINSGKRKCVVGSAALSRCGPAGPRVAEIPAAPAPLPDARPPADASFFDAGRVLGSVPLPTDQGAVDAYLTGIGEPSASYAIDGIVHPGLLLQGANRILTANVVLPAWLHVESEVHHLRTVSVGEEVEVRARIAAVFERKGHRFAELDVRWLAGGTAVAAARHVAIWQLATS